MGPVKNQGDCGSCWAFAATTIMETMQAIKYGTILKLSEQEALDCTDAEAKLIHGVDYRSFGCDGGNPLSYWWFGITHGVQSLASYGYTGRDEQCKFSNRVVVARGDTWGIERQMSVDQILAQLRKGPLNVAINAQTLDFQFYRSGVLDATANCPGEYADVNHSVVLVGYSEQTVPLFREECVDYESYKDVTTTVTKRRGKKSR